MDLVNFCQAASVHFCMRIDPGVNISIRLQCNSYKKSGMDIRIDCWKLMPAIWWQINNNQIITECIDNQCPYIELAQRAGAIFKSYWGLMRAMKFYWWIFLWWIFHWLEGVKFCVIIQSFVWSKFGCTKR